MKTAIRFGLCGRPIAHSLSPRLFAAAYPQGRFSYEAIPVSDPEEAVRLLAAGGFAGINVTAPLKTSILPFVRRQTPECAAIGACNLILRQGGIPTAHNTDHLGVAHSIARAKVSVKNATCLLLGAGGAARAAAYALLQAGAVLLWANRTPAHIPNPFHAYPITSLSLSRATQHAAACRLIVNTLPYAVPETQHLRLTAAQTVFDASYADAPLARQAREAGARYIDGKQWLLHQAIPAFTAMTGLAPDIAAMEICLYSNLSLP